jgi:hypothetical protein
MQQQQVMSRQQTATACCSVLRPCLYRLTQACAFEALICKLLNTCMNSCSPCCMWMFQLLQPITHAAIPGLLQQQQQCLTWSTRYASPPQYCIFWLMMVALPVPC